MQFPREFNGQIDMVYSSPELTVIVPKTHGASVFTGSDTRWCSANPNSGYEVFYHLSNENCLFRFLFSDGTKIRLTWKCDGWFSWANASSNELNGNDPFTPFDIEYLNNRIKELKFHEWHIYYPEKFQEYTELFNSIIKIDESVFLKVQEYYDNRFIKEGRVAYSR